MLPLFSFVRSLSPRDWMELVLVPLTALGVTWIWNVRQSRADRYRFINEDYESLLKLCLEHPRYVDPHVCEAYWDALSAEDLVKYRCFAMKVHTTMETILDFYKRPSLCRRWRRLVLGVFLPRRLPRVDGVVASEVWIDDEWFHFYKYHSSLHFSWLERNRDLQESVHYQLAKAVRIPYADLKQF